MKDPNYAPTYMALYPELAAIARKHGYALSVHGTLARDMDLVCIPWVKEPSKPDAVIDEITSTFYIVKIGKLERHEHNRMVQTISIGHGECFIDLSFMPCVDQVKEIEKTDGFMLFVFRPEGHGSETFSVVALDEDTAKKAVDKHIADNKQVYEEYQRECLKVRGLRGTRTYIPTGPEYQYPKEVYLAESDGWGTDYYKTEVYEVGQVASNENT